MRKLYIVRCLLILMMVVAGVRGWGQTALYVEDFGSNATVALPYVFGTNATGSSSKNANITSPSWTQSNASAGFAGSSGASMSATIAATGGTNVITCTFDVGAAYKLTPSSISFNYRISATGPQKMDVGIAGTGGSASIAQITTTRSAAFIGVTTSNFSTTPDLTGTITLTFTFSATSGTNSTVRLDDVTLSGTIAPLVVNVPSITSFSATPNTGAATSGYIGSTVTVSGSGFLGTSVVKVGGSGGTNASSFTVVDDNTLTFVAPGASGQIYVSNSAGNAISTASYTNNGYITKATGGWNTAATWLGGAVPPSLATTDVTIAHNVTSTPTVSVGKLTVNSGVTLTTTVATIVTVNSGSTNSGTITNNGTLGITGVTYTNSGIFNVGATGILLLNQGGLYSGTAPPYTAGGALTFNNTSGQLPITSTQTYWPAVNGPTTVNVTGAGGIQLQTGVIRSITNLNLNAVFEIQSAGNLTVTGKLTINSGGSVIGNAPVYSTGSTLSFKTGSIYTIGSSDKAWTPGLSGAGVPDKVEIALAGTNVTLSDDRTVLSAITITSGTLTNNTNTLTLGPSGGGNRLFTLNGGFLTINGGILNVNGNIVMSSGSFSFGSGLINIDPNDGTAGTSVSSGTDIFTINSLTNTINVTGGTIVFVDPPFTGAGRTLSYTAGSGSAIWAGNTVVFGGTTGVNASTATNGFNIDTYVNTSNLLLGNVIVDGGAGTSRYLSGSVTLGNGFDIGGDLTINANSELRTISGGTPLRIKGNIINNGELTDISGISFTNRYSNTVYANTAAQIVTGTGTFQNAVSSPTAKFTSFVFNNTATGAAITFNIGNVSVSGSVTLTAGAIDVGANNDFVFIGSATHSRTSGFIISPSGTGQVKRTFTTGSFTFPIGEITGVAQYSPITLNFTANPTSRSIGVKVTDAVHPNMNTGAVPINYLSRYWSFTDDQTTSYTYSLSSTYVSSVEDVVGTETSLKTAVWNGISWTNFPTSVSSPTMGSSGLTGQLNGVDFTGRAGFNPTQLVITAISPNPPTAGSTFSITVQAQDGTGTPQNVLAATAFNFTTNGNAGAISGTITGTIPAGSSSVTVSGVTLATAGTNVTVTASRTSGDNLTAGLSNTFTVNPATPTITTISPSSAYAGGTGFTLTVNGTNFFSGSVIRWNGADRTTSFVSPTQLTAAISASDIASYSTVSVTVFSLGAPAISNASAFTINPPTPTTTSISPSTATAGDPAFTITVNGTNFINGISAVTWNGSARTTTWISATQLMASITAADIFSTGNFPVGVTTTNAAATSNTQPFSVTPASNPTVTTNATPGAIASTSATFGGNITDPGTSAVTENGILYSVTSTNATPAVGGSGVTKLPAATVQTGAFSVATIAALVPNTQYSYRAYATNNGGSTYAYGGITGTTFYTLANIPAAPTVDGATSISLNLTVNVNSNPTNTDFAIYESSTGLYVQADGSLAATAVWQTVSAWGTKTIIGLTSSTTYTLAVKARNTALIETALSTTQSLSTLACPGVSGLTISGITNSGAGVSWTGTASMYEYLVTTSSADPTNGTGTVISATTDFAGGLLANTNYYLHVHAKCGTGYSAWVTSDPFTTDNAPTGLITWVPTGINNYGANTFNPTTVDTKITVTGLTRGNAVSTNTVGHTAATSAWGGYGWDGSANKDVQFTVKPNTGYVLKLTSLQLSYRISSTGPISAVLSYSLDGSNYTTITTWSFASSNSGSQLPAINLTTIAALQNIASTTIVYFKIVPTSGGPDGTWYVYNEGLLVNGIVSASIQPPIAAAATSVNPGCFTANWASVTGAAAYFVDLYKDGFSVDPNFSTVAGWDFGSNLSSNLGIAANLSIPLISTGTNAATITGETARADGWDGGVGSKYWETHFSTTGYYNVKVSSSQRSSNTGPKDFKLQYKIGVGGTYADVTGATAIVLANDYIFGSLTNVPLPSSCDNVPAIYLRWIMTTNTAVTGGNVASLGASNIDDIVITGNAGTATQYVYQNKPAGNATSLIITGLTPSTKYYYVVRSSSGSISSSNSNVITLTTTDQTVVDYRTIGSGNYSNASIWEYDAGCGAAWVQATVPPGIGNNVTIQSPHTITLDANASIGNTKVLVVNSGGTLDLTDKVLSGAGAFTLSSGSKLIIGSANGVTAAGATGNIQLSGTRTFSKSADYTYNSALAQSTGDGLPDSVNNFSVAANVAMTKSVTVTGSLNIASGTLAINGNTLTANGSYTGSGYVKGSRTSNLIVNGTGAFGTVYFDPSSDTTTNVLKSLTVNRPSSTITLGNRLYIINVLTATDGTLNANSNLTIRSTSIGTTARVAPVGTSAMISGNVTVERYMSQRRAFRFVSPAVTSATSIKANWMEGGLNPDPYTNVNPKPGFGTQITGSGGTANGFDPTPTNNPSLFTFDNASQMWSPAPNTGSLLKAGNAWRFFIRGDRNHNLVLNPYDSSTTIIRSTGVLKTGPVIFNKNANPDLPVLNNTANAFNLIGNPYASPVNWNLVALQDTKFYYTIWDPIINKRGAYVTYGLGLTDNASSKMNKEIQSGQAFFVQTGVSGSNTNPQVTFTESAKSDSNTLVFRTDSFSTNLFVQLLLHDTIEDMVSADGLAVVFDNSFSKAVGNEDSYKLPNPDENIAVHRDGIDLNIEGRPMIELYDTIPLKIWNYTQSDYYLQVKANNISSSLDAYLKDSYLQTETRISLTDTTLVSFSLTADSASAASNRFMIVFRPSKSLPVTVTNLKGYEKDKGIQLDWISHSEINIEKYVIEKSLNGHDFNKAGFVKAKGNNSLNETYGWFDSDAQPGPNFYRIGIIDKAGSIQYTPVVKVTIARAAPGISVYPNPAVDNTIGLQVTNMEKGRYAVNLFNGLGQKMFSGFVDHPGGSAYYPVKTGRIMGKGAYRVTIKNGETTINATLIF